MADSAIAAGNRLDRVLQLGSGRLALVSHSAQFHGSGALDGDLSLSSDAGVRAAADQKGSTTEDAGDTGERRFHHGGHGVHRGQFMNHGERGHYWIGLLLGVALIPVLRSQHLPLKFDWITLGVAYWLMLAAQSIFLAAIL